MLSINPFVELSTFISPIAMQVFVLVMVALTVGGTVLDMIHKKNAKYFFENSNKLKKSATRHVPAGEKVAIIAKTLANDVATSAEFCGFKRRMAHLLGMYGTIIFWVTSVIMIFSYPTSTSTPVLYPVLWHIGAFMTCLGGYWFWFFLRVDVRSEGNPWNRIVMADLFVLALVSTSTFGLLWSFFQSINSVGLSSLFLFLFISSNVVLFGGVYWSKFAHMFYKPGAAIQKHLAEADGSRDFLPEPADKPKQYGLGIKRSEPQNY